MTAPQLDYCRNCQAVCDEGADYCCDDCERQHTRSRAARGVAWRSWLVRAWARLTDWARR